MAILEKFEQELEILSRSVLPRDAKVRTVDQLYTRLLDIRTDIERDGGYSFDKNPLDLEDAMVNLFVEWRSSDELVERERREEADAAAGRGKGSLRGSQATAERRQRWAATVREEA